MKNRLLQFTLMVILAGFGTGFLTANAQQNASINSSTIGDKYLAQIRNNQHSHDISVMDLYNAEKQVAAMRNSKSDFSWESVGPTNMGGPVKALIVDNQDPNGNVLYAGSIQGGLWKSTNNGSLWAEIKVGKRLNVSSICQDANGVIYVATGVNQAPYENKLDMGDSYGQGIYKSTDGTTFSLMEGTTPSSYDLEGDWVFINKIAVDANGHLYAATNTGLKYFDGTTWKAATSEGTALTGIAYDVVAKNNMVITAINNTTYLSKNGADGFADITGEGDNVLPANQQYSNIKFDIAQANQDYIYAMYIYSGTKKGRLASIYLSKDKGNTWTAIHPGYGSGSSDDPIFGNEKPAYGISNCAIMSYPQDANRVLVAGKVVFEGYANDAGNFYSWVQKTNGIIVPIPNYMNVYLHYGVYNLTYNPKRTGYYYFATKGGVSMTTNNLKSTKQVNKNLLNSMYFTLNADKNDNVIAGSYENGVHYISNNISHQANQMLPKPQDITTGGYNHISFLNPNFVICSGTNDNSMWRSNDKGGDREIFKEDIFKTSSFIPFIMWESRNGSFAKDSMDYTAKKDLAAGTTIYIKSRTAEVPFAYTTTGDIKKDSTFKVISPIISRSFVASNSEKRGVYLNTHILDYTVKPAGGIGSWWKLSNMEGTPTAMGLSFDSDVLWVGNDQGKLYRISNLRAAHSSATASMDSSACVVQVLEIETGSQAITTISLDPQSADNVLLGFGNYGNTEYVKVSTNANDATPTFNSVQGNLPKMPVYASTFESNNHGMVFLGTDKGLYYTNNVFASPVVWTMDDSEFGDIPVMAIKQQQVNWAPYYVPVFNFADHGSTNYGALYIATFGNAIYKSKKFIGITEMGEDNDSQDNELFVYPNPATQQAFIKYTAKQMGTAQVMIYDISGKLVGQQAYNINSLDNTLELNVENLNNGVYIIYLNDGVQKLQSKLMITK